VAKVGLANDKWTFCSRKKNVLTMLQWQGDHISGLCNKRPTVFPASATKGQQYFLPLQPFGICKSSFTIL
jgi:hypothetical protein